MVHAMAIWQRNLYEFLGQGKPPYCMSSIRLENVEKMLSNNESTYKTQLWMLYPTWLPTFMEPWELGQITFEPLEDNLGA